MNKDLKVVAVIPARGGSKRLPGKNLIKLAGKPLIAWTIEAAIESATFDEIVVSSDDNRILAEASKYDNIITLNRPDYLASDTATTTDAVAHALDELEDRGIRFHVVAVLQPTSPLRKAEDITAALGQFLEHQGEILVSVCELDHPLEWSGALDSNCRLVGLHNSLHRSQDYEKRYRLNGAIYICRRENIQAGKPLIAEAPLAYVMPRLRSLDIDTSLDLKLCELILNND